MKNLLLIKLEISNWRGQNRVVYPFEVITTIKGKNGSGKTSVMSAWYWLLSGYTDANTPQNHNLFDSTKELTKDTPSASVKAMVRIDGIDWLLEKKVLASFKRDKTNDTWVKAQSDTYTYHIDGIEVSATDFKKWIDSNICPIEMITFCMCGQFFSSLAIEDKKQARMYLERICGEIKLEDLNERDYSPLASMFAKGYSIDKIKESFKSTLKTYRENMEKIPSEIEVKNTIIADLKKIDFDSIERMVEEYKKEIEDIDAKIKLQNALTESETKVLSDLSEKIVSKRMELRGYWEGHNASQESLKTALKCEINDVVAYNYEVDKANAKIKAKKAEDERLLALEKAYLESLHNERNRLVVERDETKELVYKEEKCSYCGQELPIEMLEESKRIFNERKQQRLDAIVKQGKAIKEKIIASEEKIKSLEEAIDNVEPLREHKSSDSIKEELAKIEAQEVDFKDTSTYKEYMSQIEELEEQARQLRNKSTETTDWTSVKREKMNALLDCNKELGKKSWIDEYERDVVNLQDTMRQLGIECASLEGKIALCDAFVEEKARLVSNRVNDKLVGCEIQMWERLKNGDLTPACTVQSKDGVKLSTINYSRRLLIEAELQKLFCNAYGIKMPIFYDEANVFDSEHKPTSDGWQVFLLQASDDERLIVE